MNVNKGMNVNHSIYLSKTGCDIMYDDVKNNISKKCDDIIHRIESFKAAVNSNSDVDSIKLPFDEVQSYLSDKTTDWFDSELAKLVRSEIIRVAGYKISRNIITDQLPRYEDIIKSDYIEPLTFVQEWYDDGCDDLVVNCSIPTITPERTVNFVHDQRIVEYLSSLWKTKVHTTTSRNIKYYPGDTIVYVIPKNDKFDAVFYRVDTLSRYMTYRMVMPIRFDIEERDDRYCNFNTSLKALLMYQKLAKTKMPKSRFETFKKEVQK